MLTTEDVPLLKRHLGILWRLIGGSVGLTRIFASSIRIFIETNLYDFWNGASINYSWSIRAKPTDTRNIKYQKKCIHWCSGLCSSDHLKPEKYWLGGQNLGEWHQNIIQLLQGISLFLTAEVFIIMYPMVARV